MPKYEHIVPKQTGAGFSQDPPQDIPNAGGGFLDKELTTSNAVVLGVGAMYGKKIISTGFNAALNQIGDYKYERYVEIGTKAATYLAIGIASGPAAVFTVPAAVATDIAIKGIEDTVANHETQLDNERLVQERGARRKLGKGGIYD